MVLTRPGVVRAAPALARSSRLRLPPASPGCCDSPAARSRTPPDPTAPRGARPRPPSAHATHPARHRRSAPTAPPSPRPPARRAHPAPVAAAARCGLRRRQRRPRDLRSPCGPPVLADLVSPPVTLPTGADEAGGPPTSSSTSYGTTSGCERREVVVRAAPDAL